jgi:hypothetical protein
MNLIMYAGLRTLGTYILLMFLTRTMGRKLISQMTLHVWHRVNILKMYLFKEYFSMY